LGYTNFSGGFSADNNSTANSAIGARLASTSSAFERTLCAVSNLAYHVTFLPETGRDASDFDTGVQVVERTPSPGPLAPTYPSSDTKENKSQLSANVLQTQVDAQCNKPATVDVPWRKADNRLSSEFGTMVSEEGPLFLDIPEFP